MLTRGEPQTPWTWPSTAKEKRKYVNSLRCSKDDITAARSALGKVVHVCHHETNLPVLRVTTCGSVGKRTASTKSFDLDLVVTIDGLDPKSIQSRIGSILDQIQDAMDRRYPGTRDPDWYRKFGLRYKIEHMEIDILIAAPGVLPKDFLEATPVERAFLSASVSHLTKRVVGHFPVLYGDIVRVVKDWRDSFRWPTNAKPKSYLLELLVLQAYKGNPYFVDPGYVHVGLMQRILARFFELIAQVPLVDEMDKDCYYSKDNLPRLFACSEKYYKIADLPLDDPEPIFAVKLKSSKELRKATAIVMDPVNPTNNLWLTLRAPDLLVHRARDAHEQFVRCT